MITILNLPSVTRTEEDGKLLFQALVVRVLYPIFLLDGLMNAVRQETLLKSYS